MKHFAAAALIYLVIILGYLLGTHMVRVSAFSGAQGQSKMHFSLQSNGVSTTGCTGAPPAQDCDKEGAYQLIENAPSQPAMTPGSLQRVRLP